MTSWQDRMQALKPEEQVQSRGKWPSFTRPQGEGQGQGSWGAFSREPKNQGIAIAQTVKAAEDSAAARAAMAEKRKYEEAVNLTSEKAYPSLGSIAPAPVQQKTALNFRETVKAVLAKEEDAAETEEGHGEGEEEKNQARPQARVTRTMAQSFMDSFNDDDDDDDDEDDESEFNADTVQNRRRGDKGIW